MFFFNPATILASFSTQLRSNLSIQLPSFEKITVVSSSNVSVEISRSLKVSKEKNRIKSRRPW